MNDLRQTKEWGVYLEARGWRVRRIGKVFVFIKKMPLVGFAIMKVQRWKGALDFNRLKQLQRKYRVFYTILEPGQDSVEQKKFLGYRQSKSVFLPSKTIIIDLKKSKKGLWNDLSKNANRILKKNLLSSDLEIKEIGVDKFYDAWEKAGRWKGLNRKNLRNLKKAFGGKCRLVVSCKANRFLSGIVLLESKNTVNYFQSWTNKEGRELKAHYFLIWSEILAGKKRGLRYWDFEGIFDSRFPLKKWQGFSEFKRKFGGEELELPGCWVRWF